MTDTEHQSIKLNGGPLDGCTFAGLPNTKTLHMEGGEYQRILPDDDNTFDWVPHHYHPPYPGEIPPAPPPTDSELADDSDRTRFMDDDYDTIRQPPHYNAGEVETIDLNENAPANLAAAVKYLDRANKKPGEDQSEAVAKARWYVLREFMRQGWITEDQWRKAVGREPRKTAMDHDREYAPLRREWEEAYTYHPNGVREAVRELANKWRRKWYD